jgi:hypothetical protein
MDLNFILVEADPSILHISVYGVVWDIWLNASPLVDVSSGLNQLRRELFIAGLSTAILHNYLTDRDVCSSQSGREPHPHVRAPIASPPDEEE